MLFIYCCKCFSDNCSHWTKNIIKNDVKIACECGHFTYYESTSATKINTPTICKVCNNKAIISKEIINESIALAFVKYPRKRCPNCKDGVVMRNTYKKCDNCDGTGGLICKYCYGHAQMCYCHKGYVERCCICDGLLPENVINVFPIRLFFYKINQYS